MSDRVQRRPPSCGAPAIGAPNWSEASSVRDRERFGEAAGHRFAPVRGGGQRPAWSVPEDKRAAPWLRVVAPAGLSVAASGCSRAPSQNILGSFFPSWMLCLGLGVLSAVLVRQAFVLVGFDRAVPLPLLTYLALALAVTFLLWLLVYGH